MFYSIKTIFQMSLNTKSIKNLTKKSRQGPIPTTVFATLGSTPMPFRSQAGRSPNELCMNPAQTLLIALTQTNKAILAGILTNS